MTDDCQKLPSQIVHSTTTLFCQLSASVTQLLQKKLDTSCSCTDSDPLIQITTTLLLQYVRSLTILFTNTFKPSYQVYWLFELEFCQKPTISMIRRDDKIKTYSRVESLTLETRSHMMDQPRAVFFETFVMILCRKPIKFQFALNQVLQQKRQAEHIVEFLELKRFVNSVFFISKISNIITLKQVLTVCIAVYVSLHAIVFYVCFY